MAVNFFVQTDLDFRANTFGPLTEFKFLNPPLGPSATVTLNGSQFAPFGLFFPVKFNGNSGVNGVLVYGNIIRADTWSMINWSPQDTVTLVAAATGPAIIYGSAVADKVIGGSKADVLKSGAGNDTITGGGSGDFLYGGSGLDTVNYSGRGAITVNLATGTASDGDELTDFENVIGSFLSDHITGSAGVNDLRGGGGADTLVGGGGLDVLLGGSGADHFRFLATSDAPSFRINDIIADFSKRQGDVIDLSVIDANGLLRGDTFDFIGTGLFSGTAGELRYFTTAAATFIEADVTGDGVADMRIRLTGVHTLDANDFML